MTTVNFTTTMNVYDCYRCGTPIGLSDNLERRLRNDHDGFFCPLGHEQSFFAEGDKEKIERLGRELVAKQARLDQEKARADAEAKRALASELKAKQIKKRAIAGVCPCCKRSFVALRQHMRSKHPEVAMTNDVHPKAKK